MEHREKLRIGLQERLFINGFSKSSYVVFSGWIEGEIDQGRVERSLRELVRAHPLLRTIASTGPLDIPTNLVSHPVESWFDSGAVVFQEVDELEFEGAFEREVMSTPCDYTREFPFNVWIRTQRSSETRTQFVAKLHHAIVDAHYGKRVVVDFFRSFDGEKLANYEASSAELSFVDQAGRAARWVRGVRWARIPRMSLAADWVPGCELEVCPVDFEELTFGATENEKLRAAARSRGLTFPQLVAACLLEAFAHYNEARDATADELGLMIAVSQRGDESSLEHGYDADTRLISASRATIASAADLERRVQGELHRPRAGHNDLGLSLMYLARRFQDAFPSAAQRSNNRVRSIHFTYSDLTGPTTSYHEPLRLGDGPRVRGLRMMATPVDFGHAGVLVYRYGELLKFSFLFHAGALDGARLGDLVAQALRRRV